MSVISHRNVCLRNNKCYPLSLQPSSILYIRFSVHRNSRLEKSNQMQHYADIYLLLNYSTCFGPPSRPKSGVHKTMNAASDRDHTVWKAASHIV